MVTPSLVGAHCGQHPAVAAVEICTRCGTFLCGECVHYFREETPSCAACLPLLRGSPASLRARLSPVFSALGLLFFAAGFVVRGRGGLAAWAAGLFAGAAGLALAVHELRLINAGQAGTRGRAWARAGLIVSGPWGLGYGALLLTFVRFLFRSFGSPG